MRNLIDDIVRQEIFLFLFLMNEDKKSRMIQTIMVKNPKDVVRNPKDKAISKQL